MTGDRTSQKALIQFIFVLSKNISAMLFVSISFANSDIVKVSAKLLFVVKMIELLLIILLL